VFRIDLHDYQELAAAAPEALRQMYGREREQPELEKLDRLEED
jgi:hypothetical protein